MKLEHTQSKASNRDFNKSATGFLNSDERKVFNKRLFSPDKTDKRFTKSKPVRVKKIRQSIKQK